MNRPSEPQHGKRQVEDYVDAALNEPEPPPYGTADPDRENADLTDMSKPPTGHNPAEGGEAERVKYFGPDHMREELNPTIGGSHLNKGQERRSGRDRRRSG